MARPRLLFAPPLTEEEQIVRAFSDIGPVIAAGSPDERRRPLGASRLYLRDELWEESVTQLVRSAGSVVIRISDRSRVAPPSMLSLAGGPGLTKGLQWEVATVPRDVRPEQLLFLVAASNEGYGNFWSAVHEALPQGLPNTCGAKDRAGRVRAVIGFDSIGPVFPFLLVRHEFFSLQSLPVYHRRSGETTCAPEAGASQPWWSCLAGILATVLFALLLIVLAVAGARAMFGSPVPASQVKVFTAPDGAAVPLLTLRVPIMPAGRIRWSENVPVRVTIDVTGTAQYVLATTQSADTRIFIQNTVENGGSSRSSGTVCPSSVNDVRLPRQGPPPRGARLPASFPTAGVDTFPLARLPRRSNRN